MMVVGGVAVARTMTVVERWLWIGLNSFVGSFVRRK